MWRWLGLAVAMLVVAAYLAREMLFQAAGDFLVVNDPLVRVDAVIAVAGDGPERVATSVGYWRGGYGQYVIVTGGPYGFGRNSAYPMRDQAIASGVPPDRVLVDDRSTSTFENAVGSARLMKARGLVTAVVITSPYHARRTAVVFSRVFRDEGLGVRVRSVEDSFFRTERWWTRQGDRHLVVSEYLKLLAFLGGAR